MKPDGSIGTFHVYRVQNGFTISMDVGSCRHTWIAKTAEEVCYFMNNEVQKKIEVENASIA